MGHAGGILPVGGVPDKGLTYELGLMPGGGVYYPLVITYYTTPGYIPDVEYTNIVSRGGTKVHRSYKFRSTVFNTFAGT